MWQFKKKTNFQLVKLSLDKSLNNREKEPGCADSENRSHGRCPVGQQHKYSCKNVKMD